MSHAKEIRIAAMRASVNFMVVSMSIDAAHDNKKAD